MAIAPNRYSQFKDYLTQLIDSSKKKDWPSISQKIIGNRLSVDPSGVSRFLSDDTPCPRKMMRNFRDRYLPEFEKWPATAKSINRMLQINEAWYFFDPKGFPLSAAVPLSKRNIQPSQAAPGTCQVNVGSRSGTLITGIPSSVPLSPVHLPLPPLKIESAAMAGGFFLGLPSPVPLPPVHLPPPPLVKSERNIQPSQAAPGLCQVNVGPRSGTLITGIPSSVPLSPVHLPLPPLKIESAPMAGGFFFGAPSPVPLHQRGESSAAGARRELSVLSRVRLASRGAAAIYNQRVRQCPVAPIAISYRGHQSAKDAAGMIFDHMRFQTITQTTTLALIPKEDAPRQGCRSLFLGALRQHAAALPHGMINERGTQHPPLVDTAADAGLLVIPGRVHNIENEEIRLRHEYRVIREALNRGQPILGICAGSWRIWEQLEMWTQGPDSMGADEVALSDWHAQNHTLVDVADHNYNGGMIRLHSMGIRAVCNVELHDVVFVENSLVKSAMRIQQNQVRVNSVHWKAVNPDRLPLNVRITGWSIVNPGIRKNSRQGNLMVPEADAAEAFENIVGVPILGIQWHPEGYNPDDEGGAPHGNLLRYMTLAGRAYAAKQRMLREIRRRDL